MCEDQRSIYSVLTNSQMELNRLSPAELGHAAAYEAFRYLLHNEPLYQPLEDEEEREREVLLSLAVAEGILVIIRRCSSVLTIAY